MECQSLTPNKLFIFCRKKNLAKKRLIVENLLFRLDLSHYNIPKHTEIIIRYDVFIDQN